MTAMPPEDPSVDELEFFLASLAEGDEAELKRIVTFGGPDDDGPDAGVREPRRPSPLSGSDSAAQAIED